MSSCFAPATSPGKRIREEGNRYFQRAMELCEASPAKSLHYFLQSINSYKTALHNLEPVTNDLASCSKNLGVASFRLGSVLHDLECRGSGSPLQSCPPALSVLQEALYQISNALCAGAKSKTVTWMSALQAEHMLVSDLVLEMLICKPRAERIQLFRKNASSWSTARLPQLWHAIAQAHFFVGATFQEVTNFAAAANEFEHAKQAASRGMECWPDAQTRQDLSDLLQGTHSNCAHAEREFLIKGGEEKMTKALFVAEALDVEALWVALDDFKHVAKLAKIHGHPKHEAIASCKIGVILHKCLKLSELARVYFQNSIQLAISLRPTDVSTEEWYIQAIECEKELQARTLQKEADQEHERRGKYLDVLQPQFDQLDKKHRELSSDSEAFMDFLDNNFPPRARPATATSTPPATATPGAKKRVLNALRAYHPDKQAVAADDAEAQKRFFLFEHITKLLNDVYCRNFKGCSDESAGDE